MSQTQSPGMESSSSRSTTAVTVSGSAIFIGSSVKSHMGEDNSLQMNSPPKPDAGIFRISNRRVSTEQQGSPTKSNSEPEVEVVFGDIALNSTNSSQPTSDALAPNTEILIPAASNNNDSSNVHNKEIFCWTAKKWIILIAWIYVVICALECIISFAIYYYRGTIHFAFLSIEFTGGSFSEPVEHLADIVLDFGVLFAGIYLLVGVKEGITQRLRSWIILQIFVVVFSTFMLVVNIIEEDEIDIADALMEIFTSLVFVSIVYAHYKELTSLGHVVRSSIV